MILQFLGVIFALTSFLPKVVWSYQGLLEDVWDEDTSIRINTQTEMYVMFCDISVVQLLLILGIFVHTFKINNFFEYIKHLSKVDLIIPPSETASIKKTSLGMAIAIIVATVGMLLADFLTYIENINNNALKINVIKRYLPFYITYIIMMLYQYKFWHMGHSILNRLQELNKRLKIHNVNVKRFEENIDANISETWSKIKSEHIRYMVDSMNKKNQDILKVKPQLNAEVLSQPAIDCSNSNIMNLALAYLHLSDGVACLNEFLGVAHAITILGILWHLIESPFHLVMDLDGPRKNLGNAAMNAAWCFYHLIRLLIFVEPCNSCSLEGQKIQNYVCNLLCSTTIHDHTRTELETFSIVLIQGKLEFSAAGLTTINRSLVTALLGTITTYLVILLQFQSK